MAGFSNKKLFEGKTRTYKTQGLHLTTWGLYYDDEYYISI